MGAGQRLRTAVLDATTLAVGSTAGVAHPDVGDHTLFSDSPVDTYIEDLPACTRPAPSQHQRRPVVRHVDAPDRTYRLPEHYPDSLYRAFNTVSHRLSFNVFHLVGGHHTHRLSGHRAQRQAGATTWHISSSVASSLLHLQLRRTGNAVGQVDRLFSRRHR